MRQQIGRPVSVGNRKGTYFSCVCVCVCVCVCDSKQTGSCFLMLVKLFDAIHLQQCVLENDLDEDD